VKCLTAPGEHAIWFMYEPVLISKRTFERLTPEQKEVMLAAAAKAEAYFAQEGPKGEQRMNETFTKAGVKVVSLSKEEHDAWMEVARESSYKYFAEKVKGGKDLLDKALAVQ
jgi:TRAP-type C4-dicarboxylate transport system substrate-binding protein